MGHGHTPEERGGEEYVRGFGGGAVAGAGESLKTAAGLTKHSFGSGQDEAVPLQRAVLLVLRFYKIYLSVLMGGTCRFQPTCSQYAYEAVERFGVRRGCWLTLKRLVRCQPLSRKFGYDPVPEDWPEKHGFGRLKAAATCASQGTTRVLPQGLKPCDSSTTMSDPAKAPGAQNVRLKVRPTNLVNAEAGYAPEQQEAHS